MIPLEIIDSESDAKLFMYQTLSSFFVFVSFIITLPTFNKSNQTQKLLYLATKTHKQKQPNPDIEISTATKQPLKIPKKEVTF